MNNTDNDESFRSHYRGSVLEDNSKNDNNNNSKIGSDEESSDEDEGLFSLNSISELQPEIHNLEITLPLVSPSRSSSESPESSNIPDSSESNSSPANDILESFLQKGCGCQLNSGIQCSDLFDHSHYRSIRDQSNSLTKDELDLIILDQIKGNISNDDKINPKTRTIVLFARSPGCPFFITERGPAE